MLTAANLALRFLLELAAIGTLGYWASARAPARSPRPP
jgi:hypothetical protein